MTILNTIKWIVSNRKSLFKAICGLAVGFLLLWGITLSKQNKKLSESLETALNNIEAYLGSLNGSLLANNVLLLTVNDLQTYNDKLVHELDSAREQLKIKDKQIRTAATQKQIIYVNKSKGVGGDLCEILNDTVYKDSIKYNNLTTVYYTIGRDTVNIGLDILNTQWLFVFNTKEYKNKKSFIKRLFTLDFKKVNKYKYVIENSNDLLKTEDVRVVEIKQ